MAYCLPKLVASLLRYGQKDGSALSFPTIFPHSLIVYFLNIFSQGHILLAYSMLSANPPHNNQAFFFELAHHLLKANPHKYMRPELTAKLGMPQGRDAQIQWLRIGAERAMCQISNALLAQRNVFYPNSKAQNSQ
jgi:hypothetical protein